MPAYTANPDRVTALGKKLYFYDNGIAGVLARLGEGALLENAIFNQLRSYGNLSYMAKGNDYEVDFILRREGDAELQPIAFEVKTHPVQADAQRLKRLADANNLPDARLIVRFPTPGMSDFVWGGLIF